MNNEKIPVITIDGPSGSGKGTLCHLLANRLGWHILDSGAIYRVLAFSLVQAGISPEDPESVTALAHNLPLHFELPDPNFPPKIMLGDKDVSCLIRQEGCGSTASKISAFPTVRKALLERQRAFREAPGLVTDGRDMGTIVFPDAPLKVFLTANQQERAKRRYKQLKEKGMDVNLAQILTELAARDERDQARSVAPLMPADDAIQIDTTHLGIDEALECILREVRQRQLVK